MKLLALPEWCRSPLGLACVLGQLVLGAWLAYLNWTGAHAHPLHNWFLVLFMGLGWLMAWDASRRARRGSRETRT